MFRWATICLVLAVISGLLGFGEMAGTAADVARLFCFLFTAISIILGALAVCAGRKVL